MNKVIWIINNSAGSPKHGMVFRNYYLSDALNKLGFKAYIISSTYNHQFFAQPKDTNTINYEKVDNVNFCFIKTIKYSGNGIGRVLSFFIYALRLIINKKKLKFPKPDIIISSSPMPLLGLLGIYLSKKYKAKFIFEIRDLWPETLIELGGFKRSHPFIRLLAYSEKSSIEKADAVVSVMPNANLYLEKFDLNMNRFFYIPNGISSKEMENNILLPLEVPVKKDKEYFYIVYTGAIGTANRMDMFIEAAILLKNEKIKFIIIGEGPQRKDLEQKVQHNENIYFCGSIPKKQVISVLKYYDSCYVGAMDKDIYKYGISFTKIFDYLYSAKPIIFAVNSANNIVSDAKAGISTSPNSPKLIADSILRLSFMTPEKRSEMGRRGKEYVLLNNSWDVLGRKYAKVINHIS